jgi:hypothetical protein
MASSTKTLPNEPGSVTEETRPPRRSPPSRSRRTLVAWAAATVAACAAVAAIAIGAPTGDGDRPPEPRAASASTLAPATRAALQDQIERYVDWLESRAASVASPGS